MAKGRVYRRGVYWYLDYYTGRILNGEYERIRRRSQGVTKIEAQTELEEELYKLTRALRVGDAIDNRCPLNLIRDKWLESVSLSVSSRTFANYKTVTARVVDWLIDRGASKVSDIQSEMIEEFQREMLTKDLSHRIINLSLEKLNAALNWAVQRNYIVKNPIECVKQLPRRKKKIRRDLKPDEVKALLEQSSDTYMPIWYFMICTGVRKGELIELRKADVDLNNKIVSIRENEEWSPKTQSGNREIPIGDKLIDMIRPILKNKTANDYVFAVRDGQKRVNNLNRNFNTSMKNALYSLSGIPTRKNLNKIEKDTFKKRIDEIQMDMKRLDIHSLRYTFITELIASGVDPKTVQKLAGHKDIKTTLGIYAQCREGNAIDAIKALPW